jgi:hypothetical protein
MIRIVVSWRQIQPTMPDQNNANHGRLVKGFHIVLSLLLLAGIITSLINIWVQYVAGNSILSPILILLLFICCMLVAYFTRSFPLKAQDRAIRAEEGLRYFILTRKPFDNRITMNQIIALRFAPDEEFIPLVDRAVNENLSPKEIKAAIKNWRADHHRA